MSPRHSSLAVACLALAAVCVWRGRINTPQPAADAEKNAITAAPGAADTQTAGRAIQLRAAARAPLPLPGNFLQRIVSADEATVTIPLPGGRTAHGRVSHLRRDHAGPLLVQGELAHPGSGRFMFQRQTLAGKAGPLAGFIYQDHSDTAWQVRPDAAGGRPLLVETTADDVLCRAMAPPPDEPQEIPASHPTDDPVPPGENGIVQLQSLPGATAVIYLDFDGEERVFDGWGYIKALPFTLTTTQIHQVWQGVCEDFQPFRINVTTIRAVYDAASPGHRIQMIVTPTDTAAPGKGGVAYTGSFNWTGNPVCWAFRGSGKNAIEIISHEVGHTLGLSHDGRTDPYETYYKGHDDWAPIMGLGYFRPVTQWSKGEYENANNKEDDLQIIATTNNGVDYRDDDHRSTFAEATWLDIAADGSVSNEGIIRNRDDRDAFRFKTNGGAVNLNIDPIPPIDSWPYGQAQIANLDIKAELFTASGWLVTSSASTTNLFATITKTNLAAGEYFVRVTGSGKGNLTDGYSDYASLGSYTITGTVGGAVHADHFTLAENSTAGTAVGTIAARGNHGAGVTSHAIAAGNTGGAFAIDPASGLLSVADSSQLDFEALSTRWDDPAEFELFVTISDSLGVLTETLRVMVRLTDVNEPPAFALPGSMTLPANLPPGMQVAVARALDPDRGDYVTHGIAAGNDAGLFAIDPVTGVITLAAPLDFRVAPVHSLTLRATDHRTPANTVDFPLTIQLLDVPAAYTPGGVVRTFYNGIDGGAVADLTSCANFPDKPHAQAALAGFDSGLDQGDSYGSTMSGYLIAPAAGDYTFWLSADSAAELRISPDTDPANAVTRATLAAAVPPGDWTSDPAQQSVPVSLAAGQICYIEALHKESSGADHVQVSWQRPGMAGKEIIPGTWLAPHHQPYAPWSPPLAFSIRADCAPGTLSGRAVFIEPNPGQQVASHAITGGNDAGLFTIDAEDGEIRVAAGATPATGGDHVLTVAATDNGSPPQTGETTVTIHVNSLHEQLHAWWKLDETGGSTALDCSGHARHGQLAGGAAWVPRAAADNALLLTAGGSFSHTDFEALFGSVSFSVAAWVQVPPSHAADGVLIQQSATAAHGGPGRFRVMILGDGRVNFTVAGWDEGFTDDGAQFNLTTGQTIHDGQWHHVACVRDGANGRIFIDGVEAASGSGVVRKLESESIIAVGADLASNTAFLNATVDDVRIYADVLCPAQLVAVAGTPKLALLNPAANPVRIPEGVGLLLETAASDPDGPAPQIEWTLADGPAPVTFGNHSAGIAAARFSQAGTYSLRVTASDGANSGFADLTVEVGTTPYSLENIGPTVSAGPPRIARAGAPLPLAGSVADDGLPETPAAVTTRWHLLDGPAAVDFADPSQAQTTATFAAPGSHLLRLVADDGALKTFADTTIEVVPDVPFGAWQEAEFQTQAGDPMIAGELADPDHDGRCNLLEYALGTHPRQADAPAMDREMTDAGGGTFMRLIIPRDPSASGVAITVESSAALDDPASWSDAGMLIEEDAPERLVVRDTLGGPQRFFRLRVVR